MKKTTIALYLSLIVTTLPLHAVNLPNTPVKKEVVAAQSKINLNKADVKTLTGSYKGIGKKRAEAIIAYRDSHHGFKAIEELASVKGFSQHYFDVNQEQLKEKFAVS